MHSTGRIFDRGLGRPWVWLACAWMVITSGCRTPAGPVQPVSRESNGLEWKQAKGDVDTWYASVSGGWLVRGYTTAIVLEGGSGNSKPQPTGQLVRMMVGLTFMPDREHQHPPGN